VTTEDLILQELQEINDQRDFYAKLTFAQTVSEKVDQNLDSI
jgi:hypothetical protein